VNESNSKFNDMKWRVFQRY